MQQSYNESCILWMKGNKHGGSYAETELETGRIHYIGR